MKAQPSLFGAAPRAVYSACELHTSCRDGCKGQRYRYRLEWPTSELGHGDVACWVLANPSTATADQTDPTVARCIEYSRIWGYGWCHVVNVRAWRETNPKKVPADPRAIGAQNLEHILAAARAAKLVVCGWGKLGGEQGIVVRDALRRDGIQLHALHVNGDGSPGHPLYLSGALQPQPF